MTAALHSRRPIRMLLSLGLIAVAYFAIACLGLSFVFQPENVASVWPVSGFALAVLLLVARRDWPGALSAFFVANLLANAVTGHTMVTSLGFALANCAEVLLAAWLLTRSLDAPISFMTTREVLFLTGGAVVASNGLTAVLGATVSTLSLGSPFWQAWQAWWIADGVGMLLVTPVIVLWCRQWRETIDSLRWSRALEMVGAVGATVAVITFLFGSTTLDTGSAPLYLVYPFLIWIALRMQPVGAATAVLAITALGVLLTIKGQGPFDHLTGMHGGRVLATQLYFVVAAFSTLLLSVVVTERKLADRSRRLSEERYALAQRAANIGSWDWNIVTGELQWSEQIEPMFGFAPGGFSGTYEAFLHCVHPDDRDRIAASVVAAVERDEDYSIEHRIVWPDGSVHWVSEQGDVYRDASGEAVRMLGVVQDIDRRKEGEQALAEEQEFTRIALDAQIDTLFVFELASGRAVRWNEAFRTVSGYSDSEIAAMKAPGSYYRDEDLERATASIERVVRTGVDTVELDLLTKDGRHVPTEYTASVIRDSHGAAQYLISVGRDISHRVQLAEERLRHEELLAREQRVRFEESERSRRALLGMLEDQRRAQEALQQYERIVSSARDMLALLDTSFRYVAANAAYLEAYDKTSDELIGRTPAEVFSKELLETVIKPHAERCLAGEEVYYQTWMELPKQGRCYLDVAYSPQRAADGEVVGFVVSTRDVTERKQLEEQVRQAQKMEAVGQLAGGVAHDFNNLLQVILGHGDMVLGEAEPGSPLHEDIDQIVMAANRAATLVRQLLAFSRKQVLKLEDLVLDEVVRDLARMASRVIGEHIALSIRTIPGLHFVRADRGQIEQVLMNLCVNARDAMPHGGEITISTENVSLDETYCGDHAWAEPGRYVLLSVRDTGCGMDEATRNRVFEPFFTTKEAGRGTGLGLATVYGIVRQHRGMITVYSEPDAGTELKIYFPAVEAGEQPSEIEVRVPPPGGSETILLAEDDEGVRGLASRILEGAGYRVLSAENGEEALELFAAHADDIALALLDVVMPRLSGRAVLEHIRRQRPEVRVLFASGYSTDTFHGDAVLEEGIRLIHKPYHRHDLLQAIRKELNGA